MELGGCTSSQMVRDIVKSAIESSPYILLYPLSTTNRLIDVMYKDDSGHYHAFQVTVGTTHTANIAHIKDLEEQIGDPSKLSLYYSVIENRFDNFGTTSPVNVKDAGVLCAVYKVKIRRVNDYETIENDRSMTNAEMKVITKMKVTTEKKNAAKEKKSTEMKLTTEKKNATKEKKSTKYKKTTGVKPTNATKKKK